MRKKVRGQCEGSRMQCNRTGYNISGSVNQHRTEKIFFCLLSPKTIFRIHKISIPSVSSIEKHVAVIFLFFWWFALSLWRSMWKSISENPQILFHLCFPHVWFDRCSAKQQELINFGDIRKTFQLWKLFINSELGTARKTFKTVLLRNNFSTNNKEISPKIFSRKFINFNDLLVVTEINSRLKLSRVAKKLWRGLTKVELNILEYKGGHG